MFFTIKKLTRAPAFRRAEQDVLLLCNKHLPAVLAHVDRIIRIREHEAEYQRDRQHQGMEIPCQGRGAVKQRNKDFIDDVMALGVKKFIEIPSVKDNNVC